MLSQTPSSQDFGISSDIITLQQYLQLAQEYELQIPAFQRQYEWSEDSVTQLFDDIIDFALNSSSTQDTYFIGQFITRLDQQLVCEIIDGQQRTVSIFLWLKAIYQYLEQANPQDSKDEAVLAEHKSKLAAILWQQKGDNSLQWTPRLQYPSLGEDIDCEHSTKVALKQVLTPTLNQASHAKRVDSTFYLNYETFVNLLYTAFPPEQSESSSKLIRLLDILLNQVILQHTQVSSSTLAFKIFETLNARGLNLSETDILKSRIYGKLPESPDYSQKQFITYWQNLEFDHYQLYQEYNIRWLFVFYMGIIAAETGISSYKDISNFRKFWERNQVAESKLLSPELIPNLYKILDFCYLMTNAKLDWSTLKGCDKLHDLPSQESWTKYKTKKKTEEKEIRQLLHILALNPQEWTISALCYWWFHHQDENFTSNFKYFLRYLVTECCSTIMLPEHKHNKDEFLKLNAKVAKEKFKLPLFEQNYSDQLTLEQVIEHNSQFLYSQHHALVLLTLLNYQKIPDLLYAEQENETQTQFRLEVEHIVPRMMYKIYKASLIDEYIEHIGNKTLLDKRTNIQASADCIELKINLYQSSSLSDKFQITKEIAKDLEQASENKTSAYLVEFIKNRDRSIIDTLCKTLKQWQQELLQYQNGL